MVAVLSRVYFYGNPEDRRVWKSLAQTQSVLLNEFAEMNYGYYDSRRFSHSAAGLELNQYQFFESHFLKRGLVGDVMTSLA